MKTYENAFLDHFAITARNFNAEFHTIAYSGKGMVRNNADPE